MNHTSSLRSSVRTRSLKIIAAAALTLACGLHTEKSTAGMPVFDYSNFMQSFNEFMKEAEHWKDTSDHYGAVIGHYAKQVEFWQQQLVKLQQMNFALFTMKHTFTKVESDFGVKDECPGHAATNGLAGVLDTALDKLVPDLNGDVIKQQQDLCALIVEAKNQKYNDTVDYLNYTAAKMSELTSISTDLMSKVGDSPGNLARVQSETTRFGETISTAREQWDSNMRQSDAQINMLQQMQANLSRRALNGSPSPLGTLVNTITLKKALE